MQTTLTKKPRFEDCGPDSAKCVSRETRCINAAREACNSVTLSAGQGAQQGMGDQSRRMRWRRAWEYLAYRASACRNWRFIWPDLADGFSTDIAAQLEIEALYAENLDLPGAARDVAPGRDDSYGLPGRLGFAGRSGGLSMKCGRNSKRPGPRRSARPDV